MKKSIIHTEALIQHRHKLIWDEHTTRELGNEELSVLFNQTPQYINSVLIKFRKEKNK